MHRKSATQSVCLLVEGMKLRMTQRPRETVGRKYASDKSIFLNGSPKFFDCGVDVLKRKHRHAFQPGFMPEKAIVEIVVVSPREIDREVRHPYLADVHEAGRINNGCFKLSAV
jgi:hypothetical protein